MNSATISMLLPMGKKVQYYETFLLQYSLIISSNLIIYDLIGKSTEKTIFELYENYHGQLKDYHFKDIYMTSMMLEDNSPQKNEQRGLMLDKLFLSMSIDKKSPKFILQSFINLKEFLLLYSIFEGVLKKEFIHSKVLPENKYLKEKEIIDYIEKKVFNNKDNFIKILAQRSPLGGFKDLKVFWNFFTHFRHLFFHAGGYVTLKWLQNFKTKKREIINIVNGFNCEIAADEIIELFNELEIEEGKMFYVTDKFSNIFRNFIVRIMESLYLVEDV